MFEFACLGAREFVFTGVRGMVCAYMRLRISVYEHRTVNHKSADAVLLRLRFLVSFEFLLRVCKFRVFASLPLSNICVRVSWLLSVHALAFAVCLKSFGACLCLCVFLSSDLHLSQLIH